MTAETFLKIFGPHLSAYLKKIFKDRKLKKNIEQAVHDVVPTHTPEILVLCQHKEFSEELFSLARGKTINAKALVDLGVEVAREKNIKFNRHELIEELKKFALDLINIFNEVSPELGKRPGAFNDFYRDISNLSIIEPGQPESEPDKAFFIAPHRRNALLKHEGEWVAQIHQRLNKDGQAVVGQDVALTGQGGVGKTAMAVEYAYKYSDNYPGGVFWLQIDQGLGSAAQRFIEMASKLGLNLGTWENKPEADLIQKVLVFLNSRPLKLVILDNLEEDFLPKGFVLSEAHLLVTTRRHGLALPPIRMELPDEQDALDIFLGYADIDTAVLLSEEQAAAAMICERVDRLPLALEIMGQIAKLKPLVLLAESLKKAIVHVEAQTHLKELTSILATLNLAEQEYKHPRAKEGLIAVAYLSPERIEAELLAEVLGVEKPEAEEIIMSLAALSIIEKGKEAYAIHRLTQEAAQAMDDDNVTGQKVAQYLDSQVKAASDTGVYKEAYNLISHVVQVASLADEDLAEDQFPDEPLVFRFAGYLYKCGFYTQAEVLYNLCLNRIKKVKGTEHNDYATRLNNLANVIKDQGRYAEAEEIYRQVLAIDEKTIGKDHPEYAMGLNNLAGVIKDQGRYAEAEEIYLQAMAIDEKTIGKDHPEYAKHLNNLALVIDAQGRYAEAEEIYRQALAIAEKMIGKDHPEYATHLSNLALVIDAQGRYEKAEEIFRQALAIDEKTIGKGHPGYATHLNNLASVIQAQGRYEEAEELFRQALEILNRLLGPEHPITKTVKNNLEILKGKA